MAGKPTYEELAQRVKELEREAVKCKQAEEDLKDSDKNLRRFVDNFPGVAFISDPGKCLIYANKMLADVYDHKLEEIIGMDFKEYVNADIYSKIVEQDRVVMEENRTLQIEESFHLKSGSSEWITYKFPIMKVGRPTLLGGFSINITERKQAEKALKESEEKWRSLTENSPDHIMLLDIDYNIQFINNTVPDLAIKKVIGVSCLDFVPPDQRQLTSDCFERVIQNCKPDQYWTQYITTEGETQYFDVRVAPIMGKGGSVTGLISSSNNITDRKELEKQLLQSQKMEAIGTLAGGIAHDFNNILSIILGNTELAMDDVPEWNPARHNLEEAKAASLRAKDLIKQLLSFSRKSDQKQKPVNIGPIIKECFKFLESTIPASIEINKSIPDESGIISADPTQIHQVMLNLCTNAFHAMSENGGIMEVGLSVIDIGEDYAIKTLELNHGQYVKITVSDTGHGIAKEHLDRIFDPYFTTKENGEGSGIGLSVVLGIVKSHDGAISVESEYGQGTTFNVFLPVVEKESASEEETDTTIPTGNERILFVDDEKSIVNMATQMLERLGYTVTASTNSADTLETFRSQPDNFELIISDMSMPNITGDKLAKELQQIKPEIPIILCTGYSERINDEKAKSIGVRAFVMKPIVKSVLAKTIRKVLD